MAKKKTTLSADQQAAYKREVARVNKQLYRLEKHYEKTGENIMATAYAGLMRDIKSFFGDQKRFGKAMPATVREYQKRMNAIRRFYDKPTATITGKKTVFQRRAEGLSRATGSKIDADQLAALFETGLFRQLIQETFGYVSAKKAIGFIQRQGERIAKDLQQGKKITFRGAGAAILNTRMEEDPAATNMLERYLRENVT